MKGVSFLGIRKIVNECYQQVQLKNQISEIYTYFSRDKNMKLTQEEM